MSQDQLRPFRFWEQICSTMNLSLAFELQGPITADLVSKAWGLIKKEYPYFASTIHQDEYGQLNFKSASSGHVSLPIDTSTTIIYHLRLQQNKPLSLNSEQPIAIHQMS